MNNCTSFALTALLAALTIGSESTARQGSATNEEVRWVGTGTTGSAGELTLATRGAPIPGKHLSAMVSRGTPNSIGVLYYGTSEIDLPLATFGGSVYMSPAYLVEPFVLDVRGEASGLGTLLPVQSSLMGTDIVLQAYALDPAALGGLTLSNGVGLVFGAANSSRTFDLTGFPNEFAPGRCHVADLDGDESNEIIVAFQIDMLSSEIASFELNSECRLDRKATVALPNRVSDLVVAQIDSDTFEDLVLRTAVQQDTSQSHVGVLLGNGDASFQPAVWYAIDGALGAGLDVGDMNGDGSIDIVALHRATSSSADVPQWINQGDGSFQPGSTLQYPGDSNWIALGDLGFDGSLDLVTANDSAARSLQIHFGDGLGSYDTTQSVPGGKEGVHAVVADVDTDGFPDVVASFRDNGGQEGRLQIAFGTGIDDFVRQGRRDALGPAHSLASGDWNEDGILDVAATDTAALGVLISFGDGVGSLLPPILLGGLSNPQVVEAADVDVDGHLDEMRGTP